MKKLYKPRYFKGIHNLEFIKVLGTINPGNLVLTDIIKYAGTNNFGMNFTYIYTKYETKNIINLLNTKLYKEISEEDWIKEYENTIQR